MMNGYWTVIVIKWVPPVKREIPVPLGKTGRKVRKVSRGILFSKKTV